MKRVIFFILMDIVLIAALHGQSANAAQKQIRHLHIASPITPVTAAFISQQIFTANQKSEPAILIQLDTPGGLDSAMREIIQSELNSTIPVIVYIAPQGARAASAGALITLAADFSIMAPGTIIGAAHPVTIGAGKQADSTMMEKIENDAAAYARSLAQKRGRNQNWAEQAVRKSVSISAEEALDLSVIDLIAANTDQLLKQLDNYKYIRNGKILAFTSEGTVLQPVEMNGRQKILNTLSNPNIAYLLLMLGTIGIFFEISQPGVILPGAIGTIALLLALFAFSSLPINYVGILLIVLSIVLFILEIKVISYGMLAIGGIISMTLGSLMLIDSSDPYLQISRAVIAATVAVCAGFFLFATGMVIRTQRRPVTSGQEGMIGEIGDAIDPINGSGMAFVHGEYWQACSNQPLPAGARVRVIKVMDGLKLQVEAIETEEV